ncbi:hypothetical protein GCM10011575_15760 [Microlunatus endophyticus]|uniref:Uncharacterized protein n=1 Tax=Microlunatus endophyticus TaxID=1716077 RepID=A0A917W358_9ACTN|nr:DUF4878 domain-containing protein [Microlunatus endophyticus]GGL58219.1 hypothetical protein GCM10011575_15760 [Microlunatus endophyticus]
MSSNYPPGGDGSDPRNSQGFGEQAPNQPGFGYGQQPGYGQNPAGGDAPQYGAPQQPGQQPNYGAPGSQPSAGQPGYGQQPASQPSPYGAPGQQPAQPAYGQPGQPAGQPSGQGSPYGAPGQPGGQPGYGQPGQPPAYGQPGYTPGGFGPTGPGNGGGRSKLPFIIGGGGLALVVVVVLIIVAVVHASHNGTTASGPDNSSPTAKAENASDAVKGYLDALSTGDAKKALSYLSEQPSDTSLMTDDILKVSTKEAPITAIKVPQVTDKYAYEVSASYNLGDRPVNAKFEVDDSSGHYLLSDAYATVDLSVGTKGLPLTINGTKVAADKIYLLPGSYDLETTEKYISLGSSGKFLVQQPNDYPDIEPKPVLNSAGQAIFKKKVTEAIDACVRSTKLTAGCGLDVPATVDGYKIKDGSVHRTLDADTKAKVKSLKGTLDYSSTTVAEDEDFYGDVNITVTGVKGGKTYKNLDYFGGGESFGTPKIDMSSSALTVEWE